MTLAMNRAVARDGIVIRAGEYSLRPTSAEDNAGIAAAGADDTIAGRMPWFPAGFQSEWAEPWIARASSSWDAGSAWVFSIVDAEGSYVGSVALAASDDESLELAYWVLTPRRNRGAATSASRAVIEWAIAAIGPARIWAKTRPGNAASQRVLAKADFVSDGLDGDMLKFVWRDP